MISAITVPEEKHKTLKSGSSTERESTQEIEHITLDGERPNYQSIFDQATEPIFFTDLKGNFIDVNDSCCRMLGYSKRELTQMNAADIIEPEQLGSQPILFDRLLEGEHVFNERTLIKKNRDMLEVEVNVKKSGTSMILGILKDLTEMKKSKKLLELSKINYQAIFNQASDAIYVCDIAGNFIEVNESFCRMFGYKAEEFQALTILDVMEPEELKQRPIAFALVATGQHLFGGRRMVKKNGELLDMEINIKMYDENRVLAIARNVTEMRKVQKMISLSEARFRGAFEHSSIGMALVSVNGEWLKVNQELCNTVGYTEKELLSLKFQNLTHPDDLENNMRLLNETVSGTQEYFRMEKRYIHKNGEIVWVNLNSSLVKGNNDEPLYFVSQIENISTRKKSEESLKKSEANLQTIFDTTDTAYVLVNKNLNIIAYNKYAMDFGKNEIGIAGKMGDNLSAFFLDERKPIMEKMIPEVLKGRNISYEASYPQADGSIHWYYVRLFPIGGDENEVYGIMLAIDNITERKQGELQKEKLTNDLIVRNKNLEEFTFIISHNVRADVARLMGLANLLLEVDLSEQEKHDAIVCISKSVEELDQVIRKLNSILHFKN